MIKKILSILSVLSIFSISLLNAADKKIGFIYIGPPGDHGWTYMHDVGRKYMEDKLGDSISLLILKMYLKMLML